MKILGYTITKAPPKKSKKEVYIERNYSSDFRSLNPKELYRNEFLKISQNTDPDSVYTRIRTQARGLCNSSALMSSFFETMESEIYGDMGFVLDVNTGNENLDKKIEGLWAGWCKSCDIEEIFDFKDFEELALKHYLRDGECFIHICESKEGFKIQFIPPENIPNDFDNGDCIKKGIRLSGRTPIGYFVLTNPNQREFTEIPRRDMIHLKKTTLSTQIRGLSALSPVISMAVQKESYINAVLAKEHIGAEFTSVATEDNSDPLNTKDIFSSDEEKPKEETRIIEAGKLNIFDSNLKLHPLTPPPSTDMNTFLYSCDRDTAKGLGLSYATLTGDLQKSNYSSTREGKTNERRMFRRLQQKIIRKFHNVVFKRWLENALLLGVIKPYEFQKSINNFSFKTQGWEYIDPSKEATSQALQLKSGMITFPEFLRTKGKEFSTHLEEMQEAMPMIELLAKMQSAFNPNQPMPNQNTKEDNDEE